MYEGSWKLKKVSIWIKCPFLYEIGDLCAIQEWILFIPVSWFGASRKNDQALPVCVQSKLKGTVLLVFQQRNVTNSVRSSWTAVTMAMMKSLPVFSLCDTLALHLQSVMRCFSASSVHAMIMAEANQSVYLSLLVFCQTFWFYHCMQWCVP